MCCHLVICLGSTDDKVAVYMYIDNLRHAALCILTKLAYIMNTIDMQDGAEQGSVNCFA